MIIYIKPLPFNKDGAIYKRYCKDLRIKLAGYPDSMFHKVHRRCKALNGINMPLAITGQEAIWYKVWKKFGLTDLQIRSYFTGPAFLPWHRMSNIDHWDGPLPQSWLNNQFDLQK